MKAEAELQQAMSDAQILKLEADGQREHELQLEALKALEALAQSGRLVVAGKSGQQLLDALISGAPIQP